MSRLAFWLGASGLLFVALSGRTAVADSGDEPIEVAVAPSAAELRSWISQLDDDDFKVREAATRNLSESGELAVKYVANAGRSSHLEVAARAVRILEHMFRSDDTEASVAAEFALENLQANGTPSLQRRIASTFESNIRLRQERALAEIKKLGGVVKVLDPLGQNQEQEDPNFHLNPMGWALILDRNWKGGDDGLLYVKRLSRLGTLYLTRSAPINREAIQSVAQVLPTLQIQERGNACLGISCEPHRCMILVVQPESAAEQAGLEPADIIMTFDGEETPNFPALIELLKKRDAGEKVKLQVLRNGRQITKEVILGEWK